MRLCITLLICLAISTPSDAEPLQWLDAFKLQFATEPQISPDGENIAYIRVSGDIKTDKFQNRLWLISADDDSHQRVGDTHASQSSPSWSPDGNTLAFSQSKDDNHTIQLSSPDKRKSNELVSLENGASGLTWSPDGNQIAFIQFVEEEQNLIVDLPTAPKGAEWAKEMIQIDKPIYRRDGSGYVKYGYDQVFIVDIESGEVTQVTSDDYDHSGPFSWSKDGASIYIAGQFYADWELSLIHI